MNNKVKQTKRQKILEAAGSLFRNTHDVKKVSLETIAREAGVSPATIYNNFGNRENLLYEVIKALLREALDRNRALIHSDVPFPQKLAGIITGKMDMMSRVNSEIINKMLSQDKKIAPFVEKIFEDEIKPLWQDILANGKEQGYVDPSLDDEIVLIYVDALRAGFSARQDIVENIANDMSLFEQLTRIMFYGFLRQEVDLFKKEE